MVKKAEETFTKDWSCAGELERETELVQGEATTADVTRQTSFLTIYCC